MFYYSIKNTQYRTNFKEALVKGMAPNQGLFFPEKIPILKKDFIKNIHKYDINDVLLRIIKPFIYKVISEYELYKIIIEILNIHYRIIKIKSRFYVLELFHGPTMSFKDIGVKFMASCINLFLQKGYINKLTILVATSGDTGGAVVNGFYKIPGTSIILLYPYGKISNIQEKQMTTFGYNINTVAIKGTFDDCQKLVKQAFLDKIIQSKCLLTSANSINIARWLPQMFYYFIAYRKLIQYEEIINNDQVLFSVPSGNFGNICAAILSYKMGLPVKHLIASTNINDTIPRFLNNGGVYSPTISHSTISNAMDVSSPSNYCRILSICKEFEIIINNLSSYSFSDELTLSTINKVCNQYNYILDPHGAVAYLGLEKYLIKNKYNKSQGIFLETAHPVKFTDFMPQHLISKISETSRLNKLIKSPQKNILLPNNYEVFSNYLLSL